MFNKFIKCIIHVYREQSALFNVILSQYNHSIFLHTITTASLIHNYFVKFRLIMNYTDNVIVNHKQLVQKIKNMQHYLNKINSDAIILHGCMVEKFFGQRFECVCIVSNINNDIILFYNKKNIMLSFVNLYTKSDLNIYERDIMDKKSKNLEITSLFSKVVAIVDNYIPNSFYHDKIKLRNINSHAIQHLHNLKLFNVDENFSSIGKRISKINTFI